MHIPLESISQLVICYPISLIYSLVKRCNALGMFVYKLVECSLSRPLITWYRWQDTLAQLMLLRDVITRLGVRLHIYNHILHPCISLHCCCLGDCAHSITRLNESWRPGCDLSIIICRKDSILLEVKKSKKTWLIVSDTLISSGISLCRSKSPHFWRLLVPPLGSGQENTWSGCIFKPCVEVLPDNTNRRSYLHFYTKIHFSVKTGWNLDSL